MTTSLTTKIRELYPELTDADFCPPVLIQIRDDTDGRGAYIAVWDHPTLAKPTEDQLK